MTVQQLIDVYLNSHCREHYRKPSGRQTSEVAGIKAALSYMASTPWCNQAVGAMEVSQLSPAIFEACVMHAARSGNVSRGTANAYGQKIKRMIRWAARRELAPEDLYGRLMIIEPLKKGRTPAKETEGRQAVDWETVSATMANGTLKLATMIEVQWMAGMRPGEVCSMSWSCIDQTLEVWIYEPSEHKTEHHNKDRLIPIGPAVQSLLEKWRSRSQGDRLWPMKVGSYRQAIKRAAERAGVPIWTPHQIRHSFATRFGDQYGEEVAKRLLGHSNVRTTRRYMHPDQKLIEQFAKEHG